jgi:hypothetical protein
MGKRVRNSRGKKRVEFWGRKRGEKNRVQVAKRASHSR